MELTFPEKVTKYNIKRLKKTLNNGSKKYPGANLISPKSNPKENYFIKNNFVKQKFLENLRVGDIVHRHLLNDDVVLFNR